MEQLTYLLVDFFCPDNNIQVYASRRWVAPVPVGIVTPTLARVIVHRFNHPFTSPNTRSRRHPEERDLDLYITGAAQYQMDPHRVALVLSAHAVEVDGLSAGNLIAFFSVLVQSGFTVHSYRNPAGAVEQADPPEWAETSPEPPEL